jgi:hypothetical protein
MAVALESLNINDPRACFYKGLFRIRWFLFDQYKSERKKLIHLDADLFSNIIFFIAAISFPMMAIFFY